MSILKKPEWHFMYLDRKNEYRSIKVEGHWTIMGARSEANKISRERGVVVYYTKDFINIYNS